MQPQDGFGEQVGDGDDGDLVHKCRVLGWDGVGDDDPCDFGHAQQLFCWRAEDAVDGGDSHVGERAAIQQSSGTGGDGAAGGDDVVNDDWPLPLDGADEGADLDALAPLAAALLVHDDEGQVEQVDVFLGDLDASRVGCDEYGVLQIGDGADVVGEKRDGGEMDHFDVEKALDGWRVQIDGDDAVGSGSGEQVGDELGGNGLAARRFLFLTRIAVVGYDDSDATGGCAAKCVEHDE